jgi:endonuclease G, mitochondrial
MTLFSDDELRNLQTASERAGLLTPAKFAALTANIDRSFLALAPFTDEIGATRFFILLNYMNRVERLRDGSVPMETFLANAVMLAEEVPERAILEAALDGLRKRATATKSIPQPAATDQLKAWANKVHAAGGIEKIIGRDDTLSFSFLAAGHDVGRSIVKLLVRRYEGGRPVTEQNGDPTLYAGTGWLITDQLLVTNHHVINARNDDEPDASRDDLDAQARSTVALFDFDAETLPGTEAPVASLEAVSSAIDYAVLRLDKPSGRKPLRVAPQLPKVGGDSYLAMNIIQHPLGGPKRVALRSNLVLSADDREIRYFTDTERGSSGSPVCDDRWRVVALHRAFTRVSGVSFEGKTTAYVNSGVPIGAILDDLKKNFPVVWDQLRQAGA